MRCPECGWDTYVVDTDHRDDNTIIRRRRCPNCGKRFSTREEMFITKRERNKMLKEIKNAESIVEELRYSADLINQLDRRMLQIRDRIALSEESNLVRNEWK